MLWTTTLALRLTTCFLAVLLINTPLAAAEDLFAAIATGDNVRLEAAIVAGGDVNEDGLNGTPLHEAILLGSLEMTSLLVGAGANIEAETLGGREHPLHVAARGNRAAIATYLVGKGAKLDTRDAKGRTPLLTAITNNSVEATAALLDAGADAKLGDSPDGGDTPLHFSAITGNVALAKLLLERNVDPNARSDGGDTPLHYAAMDGRTDMVRFLAEHGADLDRVNDKGLSPYALAPAEEVKKVLLDLGAKP